MDDIRKGNTLNLTYSNSLYPATTYDIWIALRGASAIDLKSGVSGVAITTSGGDYVVTVTAAVTATWTAGDYWYEVYCGKTSWAERYTAEAGTLKILDNLSAQVAGYSNETTIKQTLDALDAAILGRATSDQLSYSIAGRSISKIPIPDLILLRDRYKAEYAAELKAQRVAAGLDTGNLIKVRL